MLLLCEMIHQEFELLDIVRAELSNRGLESILSVCKYQLKFAILTNLSVKFK